MKRSWLRILCISGLVYSGPSAWTNGAEAPATGIPEIDRGWAIVSGSATSAADRALGQAVLSVPGGTLALGSRERLAGSQELRARVRLRTDAAPYAVAVFAIGKTNAQDQGFAMRLASSSAHDLITVNVMRQGQALHDVKALTDSLNWHCPFANEYYYKLKSYHQILPGWPADYRARIESDMAQLPDHNAKWLEVRIQLNPRAVRFWVDDRLVGIRETGDIVADGSARIELSAGAQLADCSLTRAAPAPEAFVPLRLAGYNNAREFLGKAHVASLPAAETNLTLGGIPFILSGANAEGRDHLDIGRSLFREANGEDYLTALGQWWAGSAWRDPARIQLRIPNGQYDALYLIAAADGERDSLPLITAMFFRPYAGFAESFAARIPLAASKVERLTMARGALGERLLVRLSNGKQANLWLVKIPLDPGRLSAFADLDIVEVELTKTVQQYRYYPDPAVYGWHQGGLPSGVHVYAATLGRAPVGFRFEPDRFGHVWTAPEVPGYTAVITNTTAANVAGALMVATRSYDGTQETRQDKEIALRPRQAAAISLALPVKLNGYHEVVATLEIAGQRWVERRSLVRLAPDTRSARWTEGQGALFGYWDYGTGHHGPKSVLAGELLTRAGARTADCYKMESSRGVAGSAFVQQHWGRIGGSYFGSPQEWAQQEPVDQAKCHPYGTNGTATIRDYYAQIPEQHRPDFVSFFGESVISLRLTCGNYPEYWGETPYEYTPAEETSVRMHFNTAKCLAEAFRRDLPNLKILIEWGDPLFVIPLLRAGFPTNLIDGTALDNANFERLPEQQLHQVSLHRLYELKSEYAKRGIANPALYYIEGPFFPTEVGSLSWREQMDLQDRFALISMAYGVKRFYAGWYTFDSADWVGAEHYGGCGIFQRVPYCNPKPAYAAFAAMTELLNEADFDGWLITGSLTTYCLRFKGPKGKVYTLWTLRGNRPVTLTLAGDADVQVTDTMNNTWTIKSQSKTVTFSSDPSVLYVRCSADVMAVNAGAPDHSNAAPAKDAIRVADLGDGSWRYTSQADLTYEKNDFDTFRYLGKFSSAVARDDRHGNVLLSKLEKQDKVRELMPWYNTLVPKKPITLRGAPAHLGLWVKGASDWGRAIYCLRDAQGERWISIGTKDQWNCDDLHSWSAFNFDGWRYLRFELPGHTGYDNFRKHGTSWWGSYSGDPSASSRLRPEATAGQAGQAGVVDLPLQLEKIIVEQRTHILYVNDVQPVASDTVAFGKLYAEYAAPEDATAEAVRLSRLRMPAPPEAPDLPNPIQELERTGVGAPVAVTKLEPPAWGADGTRAHVHFTVASGAKTYFVWVSPHADGRGAVNLTPAGIANGALITGLRPAVKFHFWVTYQDEAGKTSKPSPAFAQTLVDLFKEK